MSRHSLSCIGLVFVVSIAGAPVAAQTTAIVTRNVNLRTGSSSSHAIIRQLAPTDELSILDTVSTNGYYEARPPGGDHGWVWARNVRITGDRKFHETPHPSGDVNLPGVLRALRDTGFAGPMRPDHGRMIWGERGRPGYGLYDRALGATYLQGLWEGLGGKG